MIPGFLENLLESGTLFCDATAATKTALGIIQLWFNYFPVLTCTLARVSFGTNKFHHGRPPCIGGPGAIAPVNPLNPALIGST